MPGVTPSSDFAVCIIITAYGQPGLLPEAVSSALRQKPACGIILVNDECPHPETHDFCVRIRTAHPREVRYLRQTNGGPGAARNAAIELALRIWPDLDGVFFLDGDNRLGPSTIALMYHTMVTQNAAWVFSDMHLIGSHNVDGSSGEYSVLEHMMRNYVDTGSLVARRVLEASIRFDPKMRLGFEDWDFWLSAARLGFRGAYSPSCGFLYRRRPESLHSNAVRDKNEILARLRRKHRQWITPGNCTRIEHIEAPRYALITPDTDRACVFTDPDDRSRQFSIDNFLLEITRAAAHRRLSRAPAFYVVSSTAAVERLAGGRLMHGLLWQMEAAFLDVQSPVCLVPRGTAGYGIRRVGDGSVSAVMALGPVDDSSGHASLVALADHGGIDLSTVQYQAAGADLLAIQAFVRSRVGRLKASASFSLDSTIRRREPLSAGVPLLLRTGAVFPLANSRRRVGFLFVGELNDISHQPFGAVVDAALSFGYSAHLFWLRKRDTLWIGDHPVFDTVTQVSVEEMAMSSFEVASRRILGLLSTQDIIVFHECPEFLSLAGELRRFGIKTVYSDASGCGVEVALRFEYAVEAYVLKSHLAMRKCRAFAVPEEKLHTTLESVISRSGIPL